MDYVWLALALLMLVMLAIYRVSDNARRRIEHHLCSIGESFYEFHQKTGQWPSGVDDLAETSLTKKSSQAINRIKRQNYVVIWHQELKPEPSGNAQQVLAYHDSMWFVLLHGRICVCWGDLQIGYEGLDAVKARLKGN